MWVRSLGQEDPLEKKWQPTLVFLPGKYHEQRSLVGYSPWSCKRVGQELATEDTCMPGATGGDKDKSQ